MIKPEVPYQTPFINPEAPPYDKPCTGLAKKPKTPPATPLANDFDPSAIPLPTFYAYYEF